MSETYTIRANGIIYARYQYEGDILFMKILNKPLPLKDDLTNEDFLAQQISKIEGRTFKHLSYLN